VTADAEPSKEVGAESDPEEPDTSQPPRAPLSFADQAALRRKLQNKFH